MLVQSPGSSVLYHNFQITNGKHVTLVRVPWVKYDSIMGPGVIFDPCRLCSTDWKIIIRFAPLRSELTPGILVVYSWNTRGYPV